MKRREFIALLGGVTAGWPLGAWGQQPAKRTIGWLSARSRPADNLNGFYQGLSETGYVEGKNLTIDYRWAEGQYDRLPGLVGQQRASALLMSADLFFQVRRDRLIALEAQHKVPVMHEWPEFVAAGGLISYSAVRDSTLQMGIYTGRILNGAKPADLPIVQSTRFELVINLKTAKALGLEIPPTLLARADEVIE